MHLFVGVAEDAKAWRYYNTETRRVQISQNITFDESDSKLFPIPDEHKSITEITEIMPLEGEDNTHERQPENEPTTPQTSASTTPNPPGMETPIHELHHSSCATDRPNYKLLNDPGAKTMDHAFVSHEIIT